MWMCLLLCAFVCPYTNGENSTKLLNDDVSFNKTGVISEPMDKLSSTTLQYDSSVVTSNFTTRKNNIQSRHSTKFNDTLFAGSAPKESRTGGNLTRVADNNSRRGYEKDLMVVLPVMQGNSDLSNSNLQMLYTKTPITAIIGEDSKDLRQETVRMALTSTTRKILEKRIDYITSETPPKKQRNDGPHHPYIDFLFTKPTPKPHKSPLDYGYPESFKFVQELNELPKNHKPEWALADLPEADAGRVTTEQATKGDPFQMFESVKPLEINKLLSFKTTHAPITDSIVEETVTNRRLQESTEMPYRYSKRPSYKRPVKKPQKNKLNPQKLHEADLARFSSSSTTSPSTNTSVAPPTTTTVMTTTTNTEPSIQITTTTSSAKPPPAIDMEAEFYNAARYTTLFAESTKIFLPTPYTSSSEKGNVATIMRQIGTKIVPTSSEVSMTLTTNETTTIAPNFQWSNITVNASSTQSADTGTSSSAVKPSELVSLTNILGENFISDAKYNFAGMQPLKDLTTKSPFPADLFTNDMKNMLIALGILKSENESPMFELQTSTTSTTTEFILENLFAKREPVTPRIDPNSYISFKKIPIDFERQREKQPVSDEMKDLLASFGLLPKKSSNFANSILTRISRQHKLDKLSETNSSSPNNITTINKKIKMENGSNFSDLFPEPMQGTLEDLGLLQPQEYNYRPHRNGHVFQPTIQLEKLSDEQKVQKINDAIETIRKLSKSKETENLSIEELEEQLKNVTALLKEENFVDVNDTSSLSDLDRVNIESSETTTTTPATTMSELISTARSVSTSASKSTSTTTTTTTTSTTTTSKMVNELLKHVPDLENVTSLKHKNVNYTSDESVISLVKFSGNVSADTNELNVIMNPPNPLSPEELQHLLVFNKNDVKRQQPNDTSTTSPTITTTTPASIETSSLADSSSSESVDSSTRAIENNNAPLPELAESFGGGETASEEPSVDDLPTPKPNGLYFYLDWNTFLNIGDSGERNPIRIRFSPRAGNARNFLPITVP